MAKKHYLTATLPDGYVKTIGPTATRFTHYWRIVAELENGKSEVFWAMSNRSPRRPQAHRDQGRGPPARVESYKFEIVELTVSDGPPKREAAPLGPPPIASISGERWLFLNVCLGKSMSTIGTSTVSFFVSISISGLSMLNSGSCPPLALTSTSGNSASLV